MIEFYSETDFKIEDTMALNRWISEVVLHENHELGELTYVFCDDEYLHKLNLQFLNYTSPKASQCLNYFDFYQYLLLGLLPFRFDQHILQKSLLK